MKGARLLPDGRPLLTGVIAIVLIAGCDRTVAPTAPAVAPPAPHQQRVESPPAILWTRQFGTASFDLARAVAVDGGGVYVAGQIDGEAFVRKYDVHGAEVWTRRFGTATSFTDGAGDISVEGTGVYVAGTTPGALPGQVGAGDTDVFVRRYDVDGNEVWTRQFGTAVSDVAGGIAVDGAGVYVAGQTAGTLPGETGAGGGAFVRKYDIDGNEVWTRQFGTDGFDTARDISVDGSGVYVAGVTSGTLPGQIGAGSHDAFLRKYDADGNEIWTRQFGTDRLDLVLAVSANGGAVYIAGETEGTFPGETRFGSITDAFVRKYDADGNELWTRQFGTELEEFASALRADAGGVYVAGETEGTLPGQTSAGSVDAFVRRYDADGGELWTRQLGSASFDGAFGLAADGGELYVAGATSGTLPGQTSSGGTDAFVMKLGPPVLAIAVDIDVRPGGAPNAVNPGSQGRIAVAVLSTAAFDATSVVPNTVRFGSTGTEAAALHATIEDVDGDLDDDLVLHFPISETGIRCGDTSASLQGETTDGAAIQGSDSIRTVGCR